MLPRDRLKKSDRGTDACWNVQRFRQSTIRWSFYYAVGALVQICPPIRRCQMSDMKILPVHHPTQDLGIVQLTSCPTTRIVPRVLHRLVCSFNGVRHPDFALYDDE